MARIRRSARNIMSSSSSVAVGAPVEQKTLPPSTSMSTVSNVTCSMSKASWTTLMNWSSAAATASTPASNSSRRPPKRMNATVAMRWPGSGRPARTRARWTGKRARTTSDEGGTGIGRGTGASGTRRQRSTPSPSSRSSTASGGSRAAVAPVTRISPGRATFSAPIVPSTTGPATTSSRVAPPTRKSSIGPLWRPTDIDSRRCPTNVGMVAGATQLVAHRGGRRVRPDGRDRHRRRGTRGHRRRTSAVGPPARRNGRACPRTRCSGPRPTPPRRCGLDGPASPTMR